MTRPIHIAHRRDSAEELAAGDDRPDCEEVRCILSKRP